jgi:pimeloyl-ACP methyl ester carboxylesterase
LGGLTKPGLWSVDVEVDVSAALGSRGPLMMRGWVKGPQLVEATAPLVYCIAGGGCSTGYFDLDVPGAEDYSMADHFARAGVVVAALDHPGIGRSDPVADLFDLTPTRVASAHDAACRELTIRLRDGTPRFVPQLWPVGLGHSMGGLIAAVTQARHHSFDALISLGHAGTGLPEVLTEEERAVAGPHLPAVEGAIVALARARFGPGSKVPRRPPAHGVFFADDVPASVRRAFAGQSVPLLSSCGLTSMIPDSAAAERAAVDVPTFVGFGDHDLIVDYAAAAGQYRSAPRVDLFVLEGSGHCHNQAATRKILWDRILDWINCLRRVGRPDPLLDVQT